MKTPTKKRQKKATVLPPFKKGDRFAQIGTFGPFARVTSTFVSRGRRYYYLTGEENDVKTKFTDKRLRATCYKVSG